MNQQYPMFESNFVDAPNCQCCETSEKVFDDLQDWLKCTLRRTSGTKSGECHVCSIFLFLALFDETFSVAPVFGIPTSLGPGHGQPSCRRGGRDVDHGSDRHQL